MTYASQPRAHPHRDELQAYRQSAAERSVAQLKEATWREDAVMRACQIMELTIDRRPDDQRVESEPLVEAFLAANLVPRADGNLADANDLVLGALIGEVAALILHRRTERIVWKTIRSLLRQLNGMFLAFRITVRSLFQDDEAFRERLNKLADEIVADAIYHPASEMLQLQERDNFSALLEQWRASPELRSVWFGVP
jgi:hypothetical protein